jgi:hypothetical protein
MGTGNGRPPTIFEADPAGLPADRATTSSSGLFSLFPEAFVVDPTPVAEIIGVCSVASMAISFPCEAMSNIVTNGGRSISSHKSDRLGLVVTIVESVHAE